MTNGVFLTRWFLKLKPLAPSLLLNGRSKTFHFALYPCQERFAFLKKRKLQIKWKLEILQVIFACYLTGLISLVVLPANFWLGFYDGIFFGWWSEMGQVFQLGSVNLVPSVIICLTGELSLGSWGKTMLIGNIAMFVPFGFFLPLITELKSRKRIVLAAIIVPICFEVAQLFFGRSFEDALLKKSEAKRS